MLFSTSGWCDTVCVFNFFYCNTQCSKIGKKLQFQKCKKHYLHFQKWQKINFCTRRKFKTTKNAILNFFSGAKINFLPFLKWQKMGFCTFEIALFSNFRAPCYIYYRDTSQNIHVLSWKKLSYTLCFARNTVPRLRNI